MYKVRMTDNGSKEDLYWDRTYRTRFGARRDVAKVAKAGAKRSAYPDVPIFCWFSRKTVCRLYRDCGNITWRIEKA